MERNAALKKLQKLLGKNLGYRVNKAAPNAEEREAAKTELRETLPARNELKEKLAARRLEILNGDSEYQKLSADYEAARARAEKLSSLTHSYRFSVGTSNGLFFSIKAQGDSWEEVINKIKTEKESV